MDLGFSYIGEPAEDSDEYFDEFTDRVLDALADLETADSGLSAPDVTATLATREVTIAMRVEADTLADARRIFSADVRTALHAAGCGAPGWPTFRPEGESLPPARKLELQHA